MSALFWMIGLPFLSFPFVPFLPFFSGRTETRAARCADGKLSGAGVSVLTMRLLLRIPAATAGNQKTEHGSRVGSARCGYFWKFPVWQFPEYRHGAGIHSSETVTGKKEWLTDPRDRVAHRGFDKSFATNRCFHNHMGPFGHGTDNCSIFPVFM